MKYLGCRSRRNLHSWSAKCKHSKKKKKWLELCSSESSFEYRKFARALGVTAASWGTHSQGQRGRGEQEGRQGIWREQTEEDAEQPACPLLSDSSNRPLHGGRSEVSGRRQEVRGSLKGRVGFQFRPCITKGSGLKREATQK